MNTHPGLTKISLAPEQANYQKFSYLYLLKQIINKNIDIGLNSNLDLKNNYDPYSSSLRVSLFDDCSKLDITYTNTRYNDNFNTQPEETIGITFSMDYLGFFGYEQSTDLLFSERR